jgi:hypothetical protein
MNSRNQDTTYIHLRSKGGRTATCWRLACLATLIFGSLTTAAAVGATTTLHPIADASSQSGDCETASLRFSLWNHIFMKFDLSPIGPPVSSAKLRLYYESPQSLTISVWDASGDNWTECGPMPSRGNTQIASAGVSAAGWCEFDVTGRVNTEAVGDDVLTLCITNSHDNWWNICAREGPNPPQLVIQHSGAPQRPSPATDPRPADGETGVSTNVDLSWTAGLGATSHDVYLGTSPTRLTSKGNQAKTTYDAGTMENAKTYYWRIDEKNAQGTRTGTVWSFTTEAAAPPGPAAEPCPAHAATGINAHADLSWTAGPGAISHDVYFGTSSNPPFRGTQTATTYDTGTMNNNQTYYWRIDEKNAYGTQKGVVWQFTVGAAPTGMTVGANFWRVDWGAEGWSLYFKDGLNWSTTTNPWNPTLVSELQQAKVKCLRFMDWVVTNGSNVSQWSQRIPKTANHYKSRNGVPLLNSDGTPAGDGYGVAYEWQIDLCNRVGADIWITIPAHADWEYSHQLALLLKSNLDAGLRIYIEWSNEVWNWGFEQTRYANNRAAALGLSDIDVGAYAEPWWKYKVYASVRVFDQFEQVFGPNHPRLVKVLCGQLGYHWDGYSHNHMILGDLACLTDSTINPNSITINAYGVAPYWGSPSRSNLAEITRMMGWAHNSLNVTGIPLVCYEAGSDNYSDPAGCATVQADPGQEQLYLDGLGMLEQYCEGVVNQYCFVGECWGLKKAPGQPASAAPKWRGALQWINSHY